MMANKTEKLEKQVASNYKDAMDAATVAAYYAKENKMLLEENAKLRQAIAAARRCINSSNISAQREAHEEFLEAIDGLV